MLKMLSKCKRGVATSMSRLIVGLRLPLGLQAWVIDRLLPLAPWPKSLAYQQCLADRIIRSYGDRVQAGPFKGMSCLSDADEGCLVPKLLGCYEEELSPAIEGFIRKGFDRVIDVGCASGYFLVGLAFKMPRAEAVGFDIDPAPVARCAKLIALNNLASRVKLMGFCTPAELERLIEGRTLLVIDCEGAEYELLDPKSAPALRRCDMIIEVHDMINPRISAALQERFSQSHAIERIPSRQRNPDLNKYPALRVLPAKHRAAAVDERRPGAMEWMVLRSREVNAQV